MLYRCLSTINTAAKMPLKTPKARKSRFVWKGTHLTFLLTELVALAGVKKQTDAGLFKAVDLKPILERLNDQFNL